MNVKITARKFKAHDSLKEYVKDEVSSLERFNDEILDVDVILSFQNQKDSSKIAELIVKVPGQLLKAEGTSEDFKVSVANAVEKMRRQLKKLKTKRIPHI
jgi:putative sigma-54 modulation protein